MAETVTKQCLPRGPRRTRSNAMIIDTPSDDDNITTENDDTTIEKSADQMSNSSERMSSNCARSSTLGSDSTVTTKLESKQTKVAETPHSTSNGDASTPSQSNVQAPEETHDHNDERGHPKLDDFFPPEGEDGCKQCEELQNMISLWELGVSGLTRNYSKILSQLNKVRNTAAKLEGQLEAKEEITSTTSLGPVMMRRNFSVSGRKSTTVRQSMYVSGAAPPPPTNLAEQMYPQESSRHNSVSTGSTKLLKDLNSHLSQAIDLCQQMAAANFKSNQRSSKPRLRRQMTIESKLNGEDANFRPALQSIAENNLSGSRKKRTLKRTPSAPESYEGRPNIQKKLTNGLSNDLEATPEASSEEAIRDDVSNGVDTDDQKPYYSHMMELCSKDKLESDKSMELSKESESQSEEEMMQRQGSIWSGVSTFSDGDVKQIMSKIADLEEERIKLLGTIDDLHKDNNTVSGTVIIIGGV